MTTDGTMAKNKRKGFDDLIARRDELDDVSPPWSVPAPEEAAPELDVQHPADTTTPAGPAGVPEPYEGAATGDLTGREQADLAACEAAIDNLRIAFWAAGKALQTIRDGRLYRATHGTFESYVTDRWDMQTSQAYRLIQAWPLAERLSPIGDKINESQVRELLPLADTYGPDAAETVYRTVTETDGVRVTASVLKGAVGVVANADRFDPAEAAEQIRAYLAGDLRAGAPAVPPAEAFAAEVARIRKAVERAIKPATLRAAASEHPDQVREFAAELRALADELEHGAGSS
jgi:hypothetical protein